HGSGQNHRARPVASEPAPGVLPIFWSHVTFLNTAPRASLRASRKGKYLAASICGINFALFKMSIVVLLGRSCSGTSPKRGKLMALVASPQWLDTGNNAWQLAAATFVGLQSIPGLTILYGGIVKKKWAINSAFMAMYAFASVLVVWVL